jgi:hypothetical protein
MATIAPKPIMVEERARTLYNIWRRMVMTAGEGYEPTPHEWEQTTELERDAWAAVAAAPLDLSLTEYA